MSVNDILQEMRVLPEIDVAQEIARRTAFIQEQLKASGCTTLVLGISGGIDSCTLGRFSRLAYGAYGNAGSWSLASSGCCTHQAISWRSSPSQSLVAELTKSCFCPNC